MVVSARRGVGADGRAEVAFAVSDTGIGIPHERFDRLFKAFSQVDMSTTRLYGGTGLGLAICSRLCELMGGGIWLESEVGRGSTFHFTIAAEEGPSAAAQDGARAGGPLAGLGALIVDDNATSRAILRRQLEGWGMVVAESASAREGLARLQDGARFAVVILDHRMPEMDGLELAEQIQRQVPRVQTPLVLLGSSGWMRDVSEAAQRVCSATLSKPVKAGQLRETLGRLLLGERPVASAGGEVVRVEGTLRILVAEDNPLNQRVALRILEKLGFRADLAANGVEVLESLGRRRYDVVLMDVQMPEMDGLEATRRIRARWPEAGPYIIAMTASAMIGDSERCLAAGMDHYVRKPVDAHELARALARARGVFDPPARASGAPGPRQVPADVADDLEAAERVVAAMAGNDPVERAELVGVLLGTMRDTMAALELAVKAMDRSQIRFHAHTIKGALLTAGLSRVARAAERFEATAVQTSASEAAAQLAGLRALVEHVSRALA
ncbi:MAG: response regulator [Myxococcales bacterium]|nr:response regulator [Myxococcales bacterium]